MLRQKGYAQIIYVPPLKTKENSLHSHIALHFSWNYHHIAILLNCVCMHAHVHIYTQREDHEIHTHTHTYTPHLLFPTSWSSQFIPRSISFVFQLTIYKTNMDDEVSCPKSSQDLARPLSETCNTTLPKMQCKVL